MGCKDKFQQMVGMNKFSPNDISLQAFIFQLSFTLYSLLWAKKTIQINDSTWEKVERRGSLFVGFVVLFAHECHLIVKLLVK